MSDFYLIDNPNPNGNHYYTSRRKPIQIIVWHTAENLPDFTPPDSGAESVARYAATTSRGVSWHSTIDSDSIVSMLPDSFTAWHVANYNSMSLGLEMATQAAKWIDTPYGWRIALLDNVARQTAKWCKDHDIPVRLLSKAEVDAGLKGITFHSRLDPTRRSDPGDAFPYPYVLNKVREILSASQTPSEGTKIAGVARATLGQAKAWAASRGGHQRFIDVASLYWRLAPGLGVRADGAYAQAYKETNGGHFTGQVPAEYNNWCGLKTRNASGDRPEDHAKFANDEIGVRAHLEHLSLYAGEVVPNPVDPRHFPGLSGKAKTFEALGGNWAPDRNYGLSVVNDYLKPMLVTELPEEPSTAQRLNDVIDTLEGIVGDLT